MGKPKVKTFKVNVTGMTEEQHNFVKKRADRKGSNKAAIIKLLIDDAIDAETDR